MRYRVWNEAEEQTLTAMLTSGKSAADIALALVRSVQSVRDHALTMGLSFRQSAAVDRHTMARCPCKCPGASDCMLRGDVEHTLHLCRASSCICHGAERYASDKAARRAREVQG